MRTLLVTGGAGYIGSHTAHLLYKSGYTVIILDDLMHGNDFNHSWATFIRGNCSDSALVSKIFTEHSIDAVMHFAAFIEVGESVKNPAAYYANNVVATLSLLDEMVKHSIKKVIFSSSAAVYGNPLTDSIDEDHPLNPINPYGKTKVIIEGVLADYFKAYGLNHAILRYFNVGGALPSEGLGERHNPESHLIPLLIRAARHKKPFMIHGDDYQTVDGTCIRDYLHVCDIARAHVLALEFLESENKPLVINLGSGTGYTVKEMIAAAESAIGLPLPYIIGPRRPGDPKKLVASSHKAYTLLKWKPLHSLSDILASAYDFEHL